MLNGSIYLGVETVRGDLVHHLWIPIQDIVSPCGLASQLLVRSSSNFSSTYHIHGVNSMHLTNPVSSLIAIK